MQFSRTIMLDDEGEDSGKYPLKSILKSSFKISDPDMIC